MKAKALIILFSQINNIEGWGTLTTLGTTSGPLDWLDWLGEERSEG